MDSECLGGVGSLVGCQRLGVNFYGVFLPFPYKQRSPFFQVFSMAMSASVGILSHKIALPLTRVSVGRHALGKMVIPVVEIWLWMCIIQVYIASSHILFYTNNITHRCQAPCST